MRPTKVTLMLYTLDRDSPLHENCGEDEVENRRCNSTCFISDGGGAGSGGGCSSSSNSSRSSIDR